METVKIIVEDRVAMTGWLRVRCREAYASAAALPIAHGMAHEVIASRSREDLKMAYRSALNRPHNSRRRLDLEVVEPKMLPPETPV